MQTKLIKLKEGYIIVSDENKKENDYVYHPGVSKKYTAVDITKKGNDRYTERNYIAQGIYKHIPTTNDWYLKERKIIASTFIPELPNIDFNGLEEEFGIIDVDKYWIEDTKTTSFGSINKDEHLRNYQKSFNKCLSLNKDKLYTEENLRDAIIKGYYTCMNNMTESSSEIKDSDFKSIIQSLQPKSEWNVEVSKEKYSIKILNVVK